MKRTIALLLCICLALCFAACKKEEPQTVKPVTDPEYTGAATVTRSGETVTITLPLSLLEEKYQRNLSLYCDDNGYNSAKASTLQKTVKVTMLKTKYDLQLVDHGLDTIDVIYSLLEGGGFPYFKKVESLDQAGFGAVTILVDGDGYRAAGDGAQELVDAIAQSCFLYQAYTTKNTYSCHVTVKDVSSDETLFDKTLKTNNRKLG